MQPRLQLRHALRWTGLTPSSRAPSKTTLAWGARSACAHSADCVAQCVRVGVSLSLSLCVWVGQPRRVARGGAPPCGVSGAGAGRARATDADGRGRPRKARRRPHGSCPAAASARGGAVSRARCRKHGGCPNHRPVRPARCHACVVDAGVPVQQTHLSVLPAPANGVNPVVFFGAVVDAAIVCVCDAPPMRRRAMTISLAVYSPSTILDLVLVPRRTAAEDDMRGALAGADAGDPKSKLSFPLASASGATA
jgi:hypothetical protein